jgi:hypothetical protein
MEQSKKQYTKSFVDFDKCTVSKDGKKIIVHVGKMMISLNLSYVKKIIFNIENPEANQNTNPQSPE